MKRFYLIAGAVLLAGFVIISLVKQRSSHQQTDSSSLEANSDERSRVITFWELYREATSERIAGHLEKAGSLYVEALELNPEHEDALYYSGNVFYAQGKPDRAEQFWISLIELNPQSTRGYIQLGDLYLADRLNLKQAEEYYREAFRISSEETGPLLRLGQIALLNGNAEQANQYFIDVLNAYNNVEAYFFSGYIMWSSGDSDKALDLFQNSVKYALQSRNSGQFSSEGDLKTDSLRWEGTGLVLMTPFQEDVSGSSQIVDKEMMEDIYTDTQEYLQEMQAKLQAGV